MSLSSNTAHSVISFVPINNRVMRLIDFMEAFPYEASCKSKLKEYRENHGVVCHRCGGTQHYWKKDKECYECKHCRYRQSLKANTVMHGSQLPLRYWFIAMHLLTSTKKSFSAAELKRQLGHKNYNPIWALLHKLRNAMDKGTLNMRSAVWSNLMKVSFLRKFLTIRRINLSNAVREARRKARCL